MYFNFDNRLQGCFLAVLLLTQGATSNASQSDKHFQEWLSEVREVCQDEVSYAAISSIREEARATFTHVAEKQCTNLGLYLMIQSAAESTESLEPEVDSIRETLRERYGETGPQSDGLTETQSSCRLFRRYVDSLVLGPKLGISAIRFQTEIGNSLLAAHRAGYLAAEQTLYSAYLAMTMLAATHESRMPFMSAGAQAESICNKHI